MRHLAILVLVPACTAADTSETATGPDIIVVVTPSGSSSFSQTSSSPRIGKDTTSGSYELAIEIRASFGIIDRSSGDDSYPPVTDAVLTVTPPGANLTTADFTIDTSRDDVHQRVFTVTQTIVIPGTTMGQMATFHAQATDDNGLHSQIVDFSALLD